MATKPAKYRAPALDEGLDILELLARAPRRQPVECVSTPTVEKVHGTVDWADAGFIGGSPTPRYDRVGQA
jgi:hypothetical protein